jgi:homoserine dehydrogenase
MNDYRLALVGFGNVGRALVRLLIRKEKELKEKYKITFRVTGIATGHHGSILDDGGVDVQQALNLVETGHDLSGMPQYFPGDVRAFIKAVPADVLFENSPVNHVDGEPAVSHIRMALELGMHAITANKGPVVFAHSELSDLAATHGRKFLFESTVMDGAPIFSLFRSALPGAQLLALRGILNSTTNLILQRMEQGETFEEALKYTQDVGLAETDPSGDVDGWDAAIKVAALVTVLMGIPMKPQEVARTGIRSITPEMVEKARLEGKRWKLVCTANREGSRATGRVAPELVESSSPLFSVEGSSSVVEFQTDTLSSLSIVEGNPGPDTTAYGLLADFINAVRSGGE